MPVLAAVFWCGFDQEVGGGGPEVRDYGFVAWGAGFDDDARDFVGVDDGEVVGWGGEDVGDG